MHPMASYMLSIISFSQLTRFLGLMKMAGAFLFSGRGGGDPAGDCASGSTLGSRDGEACDRDDDTGAALRPSRSGNLEEAFKERLSGDLEGDVAPVVGPADSLGLGGNDPELFTGLVLVPAEDPLALLEGRGEAVDEGLVFRSDAAALLAALPMDPFGAVLAAGLKLGLWEGRIFGSSNSGSSSSPPSSESEMKVARSSCSRTAEGTLTGAFICVYDGWEARRRSSTMAWGAFSILATWRCGTAIDLERLPLILAISLASRRILRMTPAPVKVFVRLPLA